MGAGKSRVLAWLCHHGYFPLESFVRVDPDNIRILLPETEVSVTSLPVLVVIILFFHNYLSIRLAKLMTIYKLKIIITDPNFYRRTNYCFIAYSGRNTFVETQRPQAGSLRRRSTIYPRSSLWRLCSRGKTFSWV